jgi:hypothetical protein
MATRAGAPANTHLQVASISLVRPPRVLQTHSKSISRLYGL